MNDRFQFRVFHKIYGMSAIFDIECEPVFPLYDATHNTWAEDGGILMQSTSEKDVNDKLFFDGDIVDFTVFNCLGDDKQYRGCINYCGSGFMIWNSPESEFYEADGGFDLSWVVYQDGDIEIIGNIYQHPNLLESKV